MMEHPSTYCNAFQKQRVPDAFPGRSIPLFNQKPVP
jgi:hypothetical protein